jgi:hypothetical protein
MRLLRETQPTLIERVLGRRGARVLRRRCGVAALGLGVALLRPKPRYRLPVPVVALAAAVLCAALAAIVLPLR